MNTTITTKGPAGTSGVSTFLVSVLVLIAAIGILAGAAYIGTLSKNAVTQTQTALPAGVALDQHERQANAVAAAEAANALFEHRRGEWAPVPALSGDNALLDQRQSEWLAGANSNNIECSVRTDLQERARCLGVR